MYVGVMAVAEVVEVVVVVLRYFWLWKLAGGADSSLILQRACNLTLFKHSSTVPVVYPFASRHEGPGFSPQGGTYVKSGFSCLATLVILT